MSIASKQFADILTKGSFSRKRWSQLTQLVNLVTPHVHTHSHLSAVQKSDKMSKRQADSFIESATAEKKAGDVRSPLSKFVTKFCEPTAKQSWERS